MFNVVLAKARTHYPSRLLWRDAGAAIPLTIKFTTKFGSYGSWLPPGRRRREPLAAISVGLSMTRCHRWPSLANPD
ncbi:hypothetical protein ACVIGA_005434 [Bradyrhizobium sp. USDA 3240]